jgi:putative lipoic acid-binding regulatory protein
MQSSGCIPMVWRNMLPQSSGLKWGGLGTWWVCRVKSSFGHVPLKHWYIPEDHMAQQTARPQSDNCLKLRNSATSVKITFKTQNLQQHDSHVTFTCNFKLFMLDGSIMSQLKEKIILWCEQSQMSLYTVMNKHLSKAEYHNIRVKKKFKSTDRLKSISELIHKEVSKCTH